MTDYTELVKALRYCAERGDFKCGKDCPMRTEYPNCLTKMDMDAAAAIEALQADVKRLEPKRGEWIDGDGRRVTARCSVCGHLRLGNGAEYANKHVHFCENCGSKIGGQNDEP